MTTIDDLGATLRMGALEGPLPRPDEDLVLLVWPDYWRELAGVLRAEDHSVYLPGLGQIEVFVTELLDAGKRHRFVPRRLVGGGLGVHRLPLDRLLPAPRPWPPVRPAWADKALEVADLLGEALDHGLPDSCACCQDAGEDGAPTWHPCVRCRAGEALEALEALEEPPW